MNRSTKLAVFSAIAIASILAVIVIGVQIARPIASYGADAPESQITGFGWVQLIISALGSLGFSAAAFWQAVRVYAERAGVPPATADKIADFGLITSIYAMVEHSDGATRDALTLSGREACDGVRDKMFPLGESKAVKA